VAGEAAAGSKETMMTWSVVKARDGAHGEAAAGSKETTMTWSRKAKARDGAHVAQRGSEAGSSS
jgi:hypothetical protein